MPTSPKNKSESSETGWQFDPDDLEKVEIVRETNGPVQVRLFCRSTGEVVTFDFSKMKKAIKFYEKVWSSRTLPGDDEELVEVSNVR